MPAASHLACLLLGSNIEPDCNMAQALQLLRQELDVIEVSSFWKTPAVGTPGPDFLNAAVLVRTDLDPAGLKTKVLRPLEARMGRRRTSDKNAPRPIDIDVITWNGVVVDPDSWHYAHIAIPAAEVLPDFRLNPGGETLQSIARRLSKQAGIEPQDDLTPCSG